ncbi:MAG: hypothetical protein V3R77_08720, partial [Candidatus Binatia bacterium]
MSTRAMAIGLLAAIPLAVGACGSDDAARIRDYAVTFSVTSDSGSLAALQFDVRYLDGNGGWVGAAGSVVCSTLIDVALATYNDRGAGRLSAAIIDLEGFDTPNAMSTCVLRAADAPTAQSFAIIVLDATTPDSTGPGVGRPDPFPIMQVTSITVVDDPPASSTTTTTFAPIASDYDVTVSVTSDSGALAALQFDVRYLDGNGGWGGSAGSVACTTLVDAALSTYNDRGGDWLSAAI